MNNSVCFIGHRKIDDTPELRKRLQDTLTGLIRNGTINFIFGDHSAFDDLCYELVTELKEKYPEIKRIKFRKDYEVTDEYTKRLLTAGYEESICPKGVGSAGRAGYDERNQEMIWAATAFLPLLLIGNFTVFFFKFCNSLFQKLLYLFICGTTF